MDCLFLNGIGYNPHPENCQFFYQCVPRGFVLVPFVKSCPAGEFWDHSKLSCAPAGTVICPIGRVMSKVFCICIVYLFILSFFLSYRPARRFYLFAFIFLYWFCFDFFIYLFFFCLFGFDLFIYLVLIYFPSLLLVWSSRKFYLSAFDLLIYLVLIYFFSLLLIWSSRRFFLFVLYFFLFLFVYFV